MIRNDADITGLRDERARATHTASVRGAWIAAVFCLIVLGLLAGNHRAIESVDPQKSPQLKALKTQLAKDPANDAVKLKIRKLDQRLRREYLGRLEFADRGARVLLVGVVMFLITGAAAAQYGKKLPMPEPKSEGADELRRSAAMNRRSVAALGVVAVVGLSILAVFSRGDLTGEFLAASLDYRKEPSVTEGLPASAQAPVVSAAAQPGAVPGAQVGAPGVPLGTASVPPIDPIASGMAVAPPTDTQPAKEEEKPKSKAPTFKTVAFDAKDHAPSADEWAANWPIFRGPGGMGMIESNGYPIKWDGANGEGVIWKTEIPLPGWNSPVVWGDRVFVSGADKTSREVYCLDAGTGKILWKQPFEMISEQADVLEDTGYAPSTMAVDGKRVYAFFPNADLVCFDFDGKKLWTKAFGLPENMYGHAASLAMHRSMLLVLLDQGSDAEDEKSVLFALQGGTGNIVWYAHRPVGNSWTSPVVVNTGRRLEVLTLANPWVISHDPMTGKEYWRADLMSGDVAPTPIFSGGFALACNTGAVMGVIRPDGQGDVTKTHVAWKASDGLPDITSPVANGELIFLAASDGTVTSVNLKDGVKVWDHAFDSPFNASPTVVGKHVYLLDDEGVMHVIAADREFKEEHASPIGEKAHASPAFVGGRIYIRGEKHLFCVGAK